jgi:hypothetical protein
LSEKNELRKPVTNRGSLVAAFVGIGIAWFQLRGMKKSLEHSDLMSVFEIEFEMGDVMQMPGNTSWVFSTAGQINR